MKARVKATGEIVEVEDCGSVFRHGALFHGYKDANGIKYLPTEIELQMDFDYCEACQDETPDSNPDYWTRLEHQYAGMAMQTMLATLYNPKYHKELMACYTEVDAEEVARLSKYYAHALVEKLKSKNNG